MTDEPTCDDFTPEMIEKVQAVMDKVEKYAKTYHENQSWEHCEMASHEVCEEIENLVFYTEKGKAK